jgi:hypothetical protein
LDVDEQAFLTYRLSGMNAHVDVLCGAIGCTKYGARKEQTNRRPLNRDEILFGQYLEFRDVDLPDRR